MDLMNNIYKKHDSVLIYLAKPLRQTGFQQVQHLQDLFEKCGHCNMKY